jgi:hypothetical protein
MSQPRPFSNKRFVFNKQTCLWKLFTKAISRYNRISLNLILLIRIEYKSCHFGEIAKKVYSKILSEMGEIRKTEIFLKGALSNPHCRFIGIKYGKITFSCLCVLP